MTTSSRIHRPRAIWSTRTGELYGLDGAVETVDFGPHSAVVHYTNERSEIFEWDQALTNVRSIGSLGLGVAAVRFDHSGDHLAVRYHTGDASLVDLERLRALPSEVDALAGRRAG